MHKRDCDRIYQFKNHRETMFKVWDQILESDFLFQNMIDYFPPVQFSLEWRMIRGEAVV